ncbi:MAG: hypothetical protein AW07_01350 [Candidatus Accumulibacter sp. SK-11]|nr:MAG: hypothetical protein AW07_01350 [Candidatus Accumulibacter sp. SK-11]
MPGALWVERTPAWRQPVRVAAGGEGAGARQ